MVLEFNKFYKTIILQCTETERIFPLRKLIAKFILILDSREFYFSFFSNKFPAPCGPFMTDNILHKK